MVRLILVGALITLSVLLIGCDDSGQIVTIDDRKIGEPFKDSSPTENDGLIYGHYEEIVGVWQEDARLPDNLAVHFDGITAFAAIPNHDAYQFGSGDFTVEMIVFLNELPGNETSWLFSHQPEGSSGGSYTLLIQPLTDGGLISFNVKSEVDGNAEVIVSSPSSAPTHEWIHVAGVRWHNRFILYINGREVAYETNHDINSTDNDGKIILGSRDSSGGPEYFRGAIDEIRLWDYARPGSLIRVSAFSEFNGIDMGLVGHWQFNSSVVIDTSGGGAGGPIENISLVPGSSFYMGSPTGFFELDEQPEHRVTIDSFYVMLYEVTNRKYAEFLTASGGADHWNDGMMIDRRGNNFTPRSEFADYPATYVSLDNAKAYADWIGGRLPTEAEWEKAARGDRDKRYYPWGDQIRPGLANFSNPAGGLWQVGLAVGRSFYGCYDMAGNAWEWTSDWYNAYYYHTSPAVNPQGPDNGTHKSIRGGGFSNDELAVRCANRMAALPETRMVDLGFRCVFHPDTVRARNGEL